MRSGGISVASAHTQEAVSSIDSVGSCVLHWRRSRITVNSRDPSSPQVIDSGRNQLPREESNREISSRYEALPCDTAALGAGDMPEPESRPVVAKRLTTPS